MRRIDVGAPILLEHKDGTFYVAIRTFDDYGWSRVELYQFDNREDAEILVTTGDPYEVLKDQDRRARQNRP